MNQVGKIIQKQDDEYGVVFYECVGNMNWDLIRMNRNISFDDMNKWSEKNHPNKVFRAMLFVKIEDDESQRIEQKGFRSENYYLYVAIDDINNNWNPEYWENKYSMKHNIKRKLPVAVSRNVVLDWQKALTEITNK